MKGRYSSEEPANAKSEDESLAGSSTRLRIWDGNSPRGLSFLLTLPATLYTIRSTGTKAVPLGGRRTPVHEIQNGDDIFAKDTTWKCQSSLVTHFLELSMLISIQDWGL